MSPVGRLLEAPPTAREHAAAPLLPWWSASAADAASMGVFTNLVGHGVDNGTGAAVGQISGFITQPQALAAEP